MASIYGVTTQTSRINEKRVGILKENENGSLAYSTDGSTFKEVGLSSSSIKKGFDYVIAPSDSNVKNADLVLTGTDDQNAINEFLTGTVIPNANGVPKTIKFLSGTVKLTDTITITSNISLLSDGNTTIQQAVDQKSSIYYDYTSTNVNNVIIDGFFFDSKKSMGGAAIVHIKQVNCLIRNCKFDSSSFFLDLENDDDNNESLMVFTVKNSSFNNINVQSVTTTFDGCEFTGASYSSDGIQVNTIQNSKFVSGSSTTFNGGLSRLNNCYFDSCTIQIPQASDNLAIENCKFNHGSLSIQTTVSFLNCLFSQTNCTCFGIRTIRGCEFNGSEMTAKPTSTPYGSIENCNFTDFTLISAEPSTDFVRLIRNCNFNGCTCGTTGSPLVSNNYVKVSTIQNCSFNNLKTSANSGAFKANLIDSCSFTNISLSASTIFIISDSVQNCIFDSITIGNITDNVFLQASSVENCKFKKFSRDSSPSTLSFTAIQCLGSSNIRNILFTADFFKGANKVNISVIDVTYAPDRTPIQNLNILSDLSTNSSNRIIDVNELEIIGSPKVELIDVYLKKAFPIYRISRISGLQIDFIADVDRMSNALINIENSSTLHEFSNILVNSSTKTIFGTAYQVTKNTVFKFSNVYVTFEKNASSLKLFNYDADTNADSNTKFLCDNICIKTTDGISTHKVTDFFYDSISVADLKYSDFNISYSLTDTAIMNYSSNAATKLENGKFYMWDEVQSKWVEVQTVSA